MKERTHRPVCPHCGSEDDAWFELEWGMADDGDTKTDMCGRCGKDYHVTIHISEPMFSTRETH